MLFEKRKLLMLYFKVELIDPNSGRGLVGVIVADVSQFFLASLHIL